MARKKTYENKRHLAVSMRQAARKQYGFAAGFGPQERSSFVPMYFHNRYNEEDLDTFEDLWAHTLAGDAIDVRINHAMGSSVKPMAEWRHPRKHGKDEDEQNEKLREYDDIMEELVNIDEKPKINLYGNTKDMARIAKVFGRGALVFEPGKGAPPEALKPIHARQLGRVFVHQDDWSLSSVYTLTKTNQATHADEMIYFINMKNSPHVS